MTEAPRPELAQASLVVEQLGFAWPSGHTALNHCSFSIPGPGLWMLVGGNGSGKSTLLRLIAGLLEPCRGRLQRPLKSALVFQNPDHQLLLPSCGSDIQLSLPTGLNAQQRRTAVEDALARVGLSGFRQRPIHTALLDETSQREVLELIHALCTRTQEPLTALWITHRLEELDWCDAAALVERGSVGPWQRASTLRSQLNPLRPGRAEG